MSTEKKKNKRSDEKISVVIFYVGYFAMFMRKYILNVRIALAPTTKNAIFNFFRRIPLAFCLYRKFAMQFEKYAFAYATQQQKEMPYNK